MTDRRKHKPDAHPVKFSREGSETLDVDDPHVFIEGPHVAGWYRRSDIAKDFLEV